MTLNRTIMELKQFMTITIEIPADALNRTIMELKQCSSVGVLTLLTLLIAP